MQQFSVGHDPDFKLGPHSGPGKMTRAVLRISTRLCLAFAATLWLVGHFSYFELFVANPLASGQFHFRTGSDGIAMGLDRSVAPDSMVSVSKHAYEKSPDYLGWRPRLFSYGTYVSLFVPHWTTISVALLLPSLFRLPIWRRGSTHSAFRLSESPKLQSIVSRRNDPLANPADTPGKSR